MTVYKRFDVCEGEPVQYVGVYVTKWRPEWGQPTAMFVEDDDPVRAAAPDLLEACEAVADAESEMCSQCMGNGNIYADGRAHYYSEGKPTIPCPLCGGAGSIGPVLEELQGLVRAAIAKARGEG